MYDKIIKIGQSVIQHGENNNRIYLMKLHKDDFPEIINNLNKLAFTKGYTKIFAKIPAWALDEFQSHGYIEEAYIPGFYKGWITVYFLSKFLDQSRKRVNTDIKLKIDNNLKLALSKRDKGTANIKYSTSKIKIMTVDDLQELRELYLKVFKSYPFPIFDVDYLKETMQKNIIYFGIYVDDKLVAASSAETDPTNQNAEMTDFARDPEYSGKNLSVVLLKKMESEMQRKDFKTLYTIARSFSAGMNITFAKLGYAYSGTLINNTNISGKIESMNVWFKNLQ